MGLLDRFAKKKPNRDLIDIPPEPPDPGMQLPDSTGLFSYPKKISSSFPSDINHKEYGISQAEFEKALGDIKPSSDSQYAMPEMPPLPDISNMQNLPDAIPPMEDPQNKEPVNSIQEAVQNVQVQPDEMQEAVLVKPIDDTVFLSLTELRQVCDDLETVQFRIKSTEDAIMRTQEILNDTELLYEAFRDNLDALEANLDSFDKKMFLGGIR